MLLTDESVLEVLYLLIQVCLFPAPSTHPSIHPNSHPSIYLLSSQPASQPAIYSSTHPSIPLPTHPSMETWRESENPSESQLS